MCLRPPVVFLCALLMATFGIPASAGPEPEVPAEFHALAFKVWIDGKQVMDPSLGMPLAGRAEVSVGASENSGYTLGVNVMKAAQSDLQMPVILHLELWRGSSHSGIQLLDEVMEVGANDPIDTPRSVEAISTGRGPSEHVRVELVSFDIPRAQDGKSL
ncbi:hypothetical protein J7J08_08280 [Stenotrophomonas sp. ISL-67]|uniref:hypothetical protein n=1 Tax=Stenotrophomonas sp. ISL-67 TaxID=2819171 RepID=UPI001BEC79FF|nr:hypothetical protein [Stenotrophomonas sp. ISL-67]MBT2767635.1 hypothetical protein [Stenotrophomonas sp. ISL-67]